jgi:outer membrane lipoprotein LolB
MQLTACASLQNLFQQDAVYSVKKNADSLLADSNWALSGRLAITAPKKSWLTKLSWRHAVGAEFIDASSLPLAVDTLVISTSLGGTAAKILYKQGVLYLVDKEGVVRRSEPGEVRKLLGFEPPLEHLKFWMRGQSSPSLPLISDTKEHGIENSTRRFKQDDWEILLERYQQAGDVWLPRKLTARGHGLVIKLVIDRWS